MKIGIVVGEASGDKLAANLFKNIIIKNTKIVLIGVIGPELKKIGCVEILSMNVLSTFGLIEPFIKIRKLLNIKKKLLKIFIKSIDIFIGVDFPGFNLAIEKDLKKSGIFTFHVVSPSIWAWRAYRINNIKKAVNIIILLYSFEKILYEKENIPYKYFGYPFIDKIKKVKRSKNFIKLRFKINPKNMIISLLPGSRDNEIKYHTNLYKNLIYQFKSKKNIIFITVVSNEKHYIFIKKLYNDKTRIIINNFYNILAISDFIIVASGTACLESALHKKMLIVIYKLNCVIFKILKFFIKVRHISLPNIICKQNIVNEYIQNEFNILNISNEICKKRNAIIISKNTHTINKLFQKLNNNPLFNFEKFFNNFFFNK